MKKKIALISGITGQDGSLLAKFLLSKNYIVHGIRRRTSSLNSSIRLNKIFQDKFIKNKTFFLHYGDIIDSSFCNDIVKKIRPTEIYHLAAQSHVAISFELPNYTTITNTIGTLNFLEAIRQNNKKIKFYNASTSEMYGTLSKKFQDENTEFKPQSPYGISKLYSHLITKNYREAYGLFCSNGILFNHESEDRGETFVTRKITMFVAKYSINKNRILYLGNMSSKRDWGYAPDYVEGMWKILNYKKADDFVLSTGKSCSVRNFLSKAFKVINVKIKFIGKGINEKVVDMETNKVIVKSISHYYRPSDVINLNGKPTKAFKLLGWKSKTTLDELVNIMVKNDIKRLKKNTQNLS